MAHRATFKPSPITRPLARRFTPLAWVLIAVVGLVLLLACIGGAITVANRPADEPWQPTPPPSRTSGGTAETTSPPASTAALPTPTEWWEGMPTPETTVGPPPFPAWWSAQMTQTADGQWRPPAEVEQMVQDHYNAGIEAYRAAVIDTCPPDYDAYERVIHDWMSGLMLAGEQTGLQQYRDGEVNVSAIVWHGGCMFVTHDWVEDGTVCTLGATCQDGTYSEYDPVNGELLSQQPMATSGLMKFQMIYDPWSGHWKLDSWLETILPGQEGE